MGGCLLCSRKMNKVMAFEAKKILYKNVKNIGEGLHGSSSDSDEDTGLVIQIANKSINYQRFT